MWSRFLLAVTILTAFEGHSQTYPSKPVRIVVPASPGGGSDLVARIVAPALLAELGQPFVVENRVTSGGIVGTQQVAEAAPDGHTLLVTWHTHTIGGAMNPKLGYHPVESFTPLTQFTAAGFMLVVNPATPVRTLDLT